jgi:hypothetical protein
MGPPKHRQHTGVPNDRILANVLRLNGKRSP